MVELAEAKAFPRGGLPGEKEKIEEKRECNRLLGEQHFPDLIRVGLNWER